MKKETENQEETIQEEESVSGVGGRPNDRGGEKPKDKE